MRAAAESGEVEHELTVVTWLNVVPPDLSGGLATL
jgi:hypothetical protein